MNFEALNVSLQYHPKISRKRAKKKQKATKKMTINWAHINLNHSLPLGCKIIHLNKPLSHTICNTFKHSTFNQENLDSFSSQTWCLEALPPLFLAPFCRRIRIHRTIRSLAPRNTSLKSIPSTKHKQVLWISSLHHSSTPLLPLTRSSFLMAVLARELRDSEEYNQMGTWKG